MKNSGDFLLPGVSNFFVKSLLLHPLFVVIKMEGFVEMLKKMMLTLGLFLAIIAQASNSPVCPSWGCGIPRGEQLLSTSEESSTPLQELQERKNSLVEEIAGLQTEILMGTLAVKGRADESSKVRAQINNLRELLKDVKALHNKYKK